MTSEGKLSIDESTTLHKMSECCDHLAHLGSSHRNMLFNELVYERLERKHNNIVEVYSSTKGDWSQTLHIILFRFLGGSHNRLATERLATIVNSHIVMRENSSLRNLEALLLGASGLLDLYGNDEYVSHLKQEFEHLAAKYNITPMLPGEWQLVGMYPHNHPTLRIAQIAACLHENRITMQSLTACKNYRDVRNLFSAKASEYWAMNFLPGHDTTGITRRIGNFKSDILGINLIAPIMFAYGSYIDSEELTIRSLQLLENIPAENNHIVRYWCQHPTSIKSAFESQALIQLSKEYCYRGRCNECILAKILLRQRQ